MKLLPALAVLVLLAPSAHAGLAEVRDLARNYNCEVATITQTGMKTGQSGSTTYQVTCALPGAATEEERKANGMLIVRCNGPLCILLRKGEISAAGK